MQPNNTTPITADDIKGLTGEELKAFLEKRAQQIKDDTAEIAKELDPICQEVEAIKRPTEEEEIADDIAFVKKAEQKLGNDLDEAVLELATDDETLKQIEE